MKLNNKGQIITLDVLFAITLIILAFLLVFKISEIEIYSSNSQRRILEINRIGDLSYNLLLNGEKNCFVTDGPQQNFRLSGTIKSNSAITKESLGIPANYNCNLVITGVSFSFNECNSAVPTSGDIYAVNFKIGNCSSDLSKQEYLECTKSGCPSKISEKSVTLKIWRAN